MSDITFSYASKWTFFLLTVLALCSFTIVIIGRLRLLAKGAPEDRLDHPGERLCKLIKIGFLQFKMPQELLPGLLHIFIFVGFMSLSIRTLQLFGVAFAGSGFSLYALPLVGPLVGTLYQIVKEIVVIGVLIGVVGFAWRRIVSKPPRMQGIPVFEPVMILAWIGGLMLADILLEAGWHATPYAVSEPGLFAVPSLGWLLSPLFSAESGETVYKAMVWTHSLMVLAFLNYLPFGKHFHILTALPNVFLGRTAPYGQLRPIENLEEKIEKMEDDPTVAVGVQNVEQYTWKELLDLYTCTECGRCQPNCPAFKTEKPLSLKRVNLESKKDLYARAPYLLGKKKDKDGKPLAYEGPQTCGGAISAETIWACTLCRDCEERCPVSIEQVPRIVELRRRLVMIEGEMPSELNNVFRGFERNSNPWGLGADKRADWLTDDLEVPTLADKADVEYLFYVGCMGSFDLRSQKVTKAIIRLLKKAGVSFGVLGLEEQCCGETARRLGNEFLGAMMVEANIEVLKGYNVKKLIAFCPHCFNTFKNEYAGMGYAFDEVWHAADFVKKLVDEGKLTIKADDLGAVGYHDSCFLGRYNDLYQAPRELLGHCGGLVKEASLAKRFSSCCGAGGGRMWMEEAKPRVNETRFDELYRTTGEPKTVGVSCPYCLTMLTDASKANNLEEQVKVRDVLEILAERIAD